MTDLPFTVARIHAALLRRGETVAVAESLTGGLIAAALTEPAGSSATFRGGLVVYATDLKASLAGVPAELLAEHGTVHEAIALALARGASRVCGTDWGLGITGVAGPQSHGGRPAGTVCSAVAHRSGWAAATTARYAGDRGRVRSQAVIGVLVALSQQLDRWEGQQ
ncbi:MAG: CinA family protein [Actinomycetota bacterium]|nr:CinA family protein [Actinomycetota bacterium]